MRFTGKVFIPQFDFANWKKTNETVMQREMKKAVKAWLGAMLTSPLPVIRGVGVGVGIPPVWTGTARGTLIPISKFVGYPLQITPLVTKPNLGPQVGAGMGSFSLTNKFGDWNFRFSTKLKYYIENEFEKAAPYLALKHKTPWRGFKIAQLALARYVKQEIPKKLPKIEKFIRYRTRVFR